MFKALRVKNFPLVTGVAIVCFVLFVAVMGPSLAPRNPLEEVRVIEIDGKWFNAPYPPFTIPGYPLGSDIWGRDVYSQMLWALRPTLLLVGYVALIRLSLGTVIGLLAGWNTGAFGSVLNSLISAAVAVPTLIVTLAVVSIAGSVWGPWGFVLGLTLTGWGDTARIVRDQTRIARSQAFVEAGRALGQTSFQTLTTHVLRQILPYVWMLLTFEISSTLLVIAGLGFLGYYVGGEVWVWISDTAATRLSGMPELGQMLSSVSEDIYTGPWKMFATGTLVLVTVLGFNLLGEGLRRVASTGARPTRFSESMTRLRWKFDDDWFPNLKRLAIANPLATVLAAIVLAIGLFISVRQVGTWLQPKSLVFPVPGNHQWGSQWHDPSATMRVDVDSLESPEVLWSFNDPEGFSGGPAVAQDGTIYLSSSAGQLHSLSADGTVNWTADLPAEPVGSPALDADGNIYVADVLGGLSSYTPAGDLRWDYHPPDSFEATSGPVVGMNGVVYYVVIGNVRAVTTDGEPLWDTTAFNRRVSFTPILSPDGKFVFLRNTIVDAESGEVARFDSLPTAEQYMVGQNGLLYSRFENNVTAFEYVDGKAEPRNKMVMSRTAFFGWPDLAGVLPDGSIWMHYMGDYEDSAITWLDAGGEQINNAKFAYRPSIFLGMDRKDIFYICGSAISQVECAAVRKGTASPVWTLALPAESIVSGGALVPGRIYVATEEGGFFALGEQ